MKDKSQATEWTEAEVERLRRLAPQHTCEAVAYMLCRTPDSVRGKARALGDVSFNAKHGTSRLYAGAGWTDERLERLRTLWIEGLSASQIAKDLGGVTRNAVIGKLHRLGEASRGRATPARPRPRSVKRVAAPQTTPASPRALGKLAISMLIEVAPLEPLKREDGSVVSILTCDDTTCRFPIGDPLDDGFALCGRPAHGRYCAAHDAIAFNHVATRKQRQPRAPDKARELEAQMRRFAN